MDAIMVLVVLGATIWFTIWLIRTLIRGIKAGKRDG